MEKEFARTLVTTALPYANGPVHIGHLAGVYVPADIYVRYLRLKGEEVLHVGGSDEHGVPVRPLPFYHQAGFCRFRYFIRHLQPYDFRDSPQARQRLLPQTLRRRQVRGNGKRAVL